jgi:hypothetical protein
MCLSEYGSIANACWERISDHFPFVSLGEFIIMPDHVHGIVMIHGGHSDERPGHQYTRPGHQNEGPGHQNECTGHQNKRPVHQNVGPLHATGLHFDAKPADKHFDVDSTDKRFDANPTDIRF